MTNFYRVCLVLMLLALPGLRLYAGSPVRLSTPTYYAGMGRLDSLSPGVRSVRASASRLCVDQPWTVTYTMGGTFDSTNRFVFYLLDYLTNQKIRISETKTFADTIKTTIAPTMRSGLYGLKIESTAPVLAFDTDVTLDVQAPPRAMLSGNASTYAGQPTNLPLITTGSFPMTLTMSDGTTRQLGSSLSFLTVAPTASTTYTITGVQNVCGTGSASGQAVVTVLPSTGNMIRPTLAYSPALCAGTKFSVFAEIAGTFDSTNVFTVQVSDSTGVNFRDVVTEGRGSPFVATLPADLPPAAGYRFRVVASSPATVGAVSSYPLRLLMGATAKLTGTATVLKGDSTRLTVSLTGAAPWYFTVGSFWGNQDFVALQAPYTFYVKPDTTTDYHLVRVSNRVCPVGAVSGNALVTVALVTATEPVLPLSVSVYPNPTSDRLLVEGRLNRPQPVQIRLTNLSGQILHEQATGQPVSVLSHTLDLSAYPNGLYLLSVVGDGQKSVYKVVKQ